MEMQKRSQVFRKRLMLLVGVWIEVDADGNECCGHRVLDLVDGWLVKMRRK